MFIPLNENMEDEWPAVLALGDTASVFYLLGLLAPYKLSVFVADTGVDGSASLQFRNGGEGRSPDVAAAYYDFFDAPEKLGAGIIRRMDLVVHTAGHGYLAGWARRLRVPDVFLKRRPGGTVLEIEGALPDAGALEGCTSQDSAIAALLSGAIAAAHGRRYVNMGAIVTLDGSGSGHLYPPAPKEAPPAVVPEETGLSAWDALAEALRPEESMVIERPEQGGTIKVAAGPTAGPKLIELGVPELHILKIAGPRERYIELTGDLERVFDGAL